MSDHPLKALRERLEHPEPLLEAWGLFLSSKAQAAFRAQGRGDSWAPRAVPNRLGVLADLAQGKTPPARRWDPRPAGIDTGRLRQSIAFRIEDKRVVVGSALDYASDVQRGGPRTVPVPRKALAAWLRSLQDPEQKEQAREAFGPLFGKSSLTANVPPRPFVTLEDEDERALRDLAAKWLTGGEP